MCLGIPGVVQEITDREAFLAAVDVSGVRRKVNVACVAAADELDDLVGQWVCLLYTSPSPRDGLLSRMPSSA